MLNEKKMQNTRYY